MMSMGYTNTICKIEINKLINYYINKLIHPDMRMESDLNETSKHRSGQMGWEILF